MQTARVFNIERFATEDGPGIRTVIFLKSCLLRCRWCANPESQSFRNEILFLKQRCKNCGKCIAVCPNHAIELKEGFGYITDSNRCIYCMNCVDSCFADARSPMGRDYTTEELLMEIMKDIQYYHMSSGGVTFSGGEPFLQDGMIREISAELKKEGITVLVETCGQVGTQALHRTSEFVDYIYYDIKQMDTEKHKLYTGYGNEQILQNLKWLDAHYHGELSVRYPYIPGYNDGEEDIARFFEFVSELQSVKEVVFLPYHRLGLPKYQGLGREYGMGNMKSLKKNQLSYLIEAGSSYGLNIRIQ